MVLRSDGALIPDVPNGDWQVYQEWLTDGNTPNPMPTVPTTREIDARRLRLALVELNLLDTIESAIATLPKSAQIDWEYATFIKEDYPLVQSLSSALGLDVNAIFDKAQGLT
jgi:hypothetical protein